MKLIFSLCLWEAVIWYLECSGLLHWGQLLGILRSSLWSLCVGTEGTCCRVSKRVRLNGLRGRIKVIRGKFSSCMQCRSPLQRILHVYSLQFKSLSYFTSYRSLLMYLRLPRPYLLTGVMTIELCLRKAPQPSTSGHIGILHYRKMLLSKL
uniref:Uncharacterized protein n=1 Tax=Opuntia streptacantha TaxID=393608 RepID=A0A7C8YR40_OPUST